MPRNPQSDVIWQEIRNPACQLCPLHAEAQTVCLLGDGPVPADGMVLGEAPGFREDELEIPFSGKSGKLLRDELEKIGIDPKSLYITNTVACRPPANRTPSRAESRVCSSNYLVPQFEKVKPRVVLVLGNVALSYVLGRKGQITKLEGTTQKVDGVTYVYSRHPASLLRSQDQPEWPFVIQKFRENLLLFKRVLMPRDDGFKFIKVKHLPKFKEGPICVDIETNGLNPFLAESKIHCMAVAQHPDRVYATIFDPSQIDEYRALLEKHPIIPQRATFEGTWLKQHVGITSQIYFDVKLGAFMIDENEQTGLKYQAIKCLGVSPWVEEMDFQDPDLDVLLPYNARDTCYELRLFEERDKPYLRKHPKQAKLLKYILLPAEEVFTDVICRGFHIDMAEAERKLELCRERKAEWLEKIEAIAGHEINPGSPKQMNSLLYDELKLRSSIKTKTGAKSSSEEALIYLEGNHPIVEPTLGWRKEKKYESTYLGPWIRRGPILHANYGFTDTGTGRLNSTMVKNHRGEKAGSTLHQCPRDPFIRNLITARNPDWVIVAADWSQIELRLVAHVSGDKTMTEIFNAGEDIHLATAQTMVSGKIDKETRKKAKAVNFGFVYGMWAKKFIKYAKVKFGVNICLRDGERYRDRFFEKYDGLESWYNRVEAQLSTVGFIDSVFGRRRHLPGAIHDSGIEEWLRRELIRQGINSPIQSAGSDLDLFMAALIASISLSWDFKLDPKKAFIVGAAHDSLIFECHKKWVGALKEGIQYTVDNLPTMKYFGFKFKIPIKMDVTAYKHCWEGEVLE